MKKIIPISSYILQVFIEDFEKNLTECHTKGAEDDAVAEKAGKATAMASKYKKTG